MDLRHERQLVAQQGADLAGPGAGGVDDKTAFSCRSTKSSATWTAWIW
jgi:hypothetical protein